MIKYVDINIEKIKLLAFSPETNGGKTMLLQDLLIRMKSIKKEKGLLHLKQKNNLKIIVFDIKLLISLIKKY